MDSIKDLKTSIHEALVEIIDNPGDEVSRLVLADMLDDLLNTNNDVVNLLREPGLWSIELDNKSESFSSRYYLSWYGKEKIIKVARISRYPDCDNKGCPEMVDMIKPTLIASDETNWRWLCSECFKELSQPAITNVSECTKIG